MIKRGSLTKGEATALIGTLTYRDPEEIITWAITIVRKCRDHEHVETMALVDDAISTINLLAASICQITGEPE